MAQEAPAFMTKTYPEQAIGAALQDMTALQGEDAALSGKIRELVGLGVAAQIPCVYCIYFHTKAAKSFGASEAEVKEALAAAAQVRKWSTILNGSLYDEDAWRQEVDAMFSGQ
jgi:AhpD family alkylhydroperoxidase